MKAPKDSTMRRLKIAKGQLDGIINMVEEDRYCMDISNQVMAVISTLKNINRDILTAHLHSCVKESLLADDVKETEQKIEEISKAIERLSK